MSTIVSKDTHFINILGRKIWLRSRRNEDGEFEIVIEGLTKNAMHFLYRSEERMSEDLGVYRHFFTQLFVQSCLQDNSNKLTANEVRAIWMTVLFGSVCVIAILITFLAMLVRSAG